MKNAGNGQANQVWFKKTCNATDLLHHKTELLGFGYSILAYGGCARSTKGSQYLAVLPKRHNNILFPKIKTMFKLL